MTTEKFILQMEEPGDDPFDDRVFDILSDAVQPYSSESAEAAAERINELFKMPEASVHSLVGGFDEVAEQIPYTHVSMSKLVTVLDLCLKFAGKLKLKDTGSNPNNPEWPYWILSQCNRSGFNISDPKDGVDKFLNYESYIAHIYGHNIPSRECSLPIWNLERALDAGEGDTPEERNAFMKAALQYLLIAGEVIYRHVTVDEPQPGSWQHWHQRVSAVAAGTIDKGTWFERVRAFLTGKRNKKAWPYDRETIQLAARAVVAMEAIELPKYG